MIWSVLAFGTALFRPFESLFSSGLFVCHLLPIQTMQAFIFFVCSSSLFHPYFSSLFSFLNQPAFFLFLCIPPPPSVKDDTRRSRLGQQESHADGIIQRHSGHCSVTNARACRADCERGSSCQKREEQIEEGNFESRSSQECFDAYLIKESRLEGSGIETLCFKTTNYHFPSTSA